MPRNRFRNGEGRVGFTMKIRGAGFNGSAGIIPAAVVRTIFGKSNAGARCDARRPVEETLRAPRLELSPSTATGITSLGLRFPKNLTLGRSKPSSAIILINTALQSGECSQFEFQKLFKQFRRFRLCHRTGLKSGVNRRRFLGGSYGLNSPEKRSRYCQNRNTHSTVAMIPGPIPDRSIRI